MRLTFVGARNSVGEGAQCLILRLKKTIIMLDCGLDFSSLKAPGPLRFRPPVFSLFNPSSVDLVLLSGYNSFTALPYLTELCPCKLSSHCRIVATRATIEIGRHYLLDLARLPSADRNLSPYSDMEDGLYYPYSVEDVENCIARISTVSYGQEWKLENGKLRVIAYASGHCVGGTAWVVATASERVLLLAELGSPAMASHRHPMPLATSLLCSERIDLLVLTSPPCKSHSYEEAVKELLAAVSSSISSGGSVFLPVYPSGFVWDLIELLWAAHSTVPLVLSGASFHPLLAYSSICAEWLSPARQAKVYIPEPPFLHTNFLARGIIHLFPCLHGNTSASVGARVPNNPGVCPHRDYCINTGGPSLGPHIQNQCILLGEHPSLQATGTDTVLRLWNRNAANLVLLSEPFFSDRSLIERVLPTETLTCSVRCNPVDCNPSNVELKSLLNKLRPSTFVVPVFSLADGSAPFPIRNPCGSTIGSGVGQVLDLPLPTCYDPAILSPELCSVTPRAITGISAVPDKSLLAKTLQCRRSQFGCCFKLDPEIPRQGPGGNLLRTARFVTEGEPRNLWGIPCLERVVSLLAASGVTQVEVDRKDDSVVLRLPSFQFASIVLKPGETCIEADSEHMRLSLKNILLNAGLRYC